MLIFAEVKTTKKYFIMRLTKYVVNFSSDDQLIIYAHSPFQAMITGMARKISNGEYCRAESVFNTESKERFIIDNSSLFNSITKE